MHFGLERFNRMLTFTGMRNGLHIILFIGLLLVPYGLLTQSETVRADSLKQAGNYEEALKIFNKQLEDAIKAKNIKEQGKCYNNIANIYSDKGAYEKSTEYYFKALKILEGQDDAHSQAAINYNIANNYFNIGKPGYTKHYLNTAISIAKGEKEESYLMGICYTMLGGIASAEKKYDEALEHLKNAERILLESSNPDWLGNVYTEFAVMYLEMKEYKLATAYSRKGLRIYKAQNDPLGIAVSYQNLHRAHFYYWNPDGKVINKNETLKAIGLTDSAYKAIEGIESPEVLLNLHKSKTEYYAGLNEYDSAYVYLTKYVLLNDSVHGVEKNRQLEELKLQYDVEKKEKENALLTAKSENRRLMTIIAFSVSGLLLVLLTLLIVVNRYRKKQKKVEFERSMLEYEQQALRAQMNPHFIFNAINSIQKYILKENKQEAYDYLTKFARLIRLVLNNSQEKSLSLQQELDMIDLYVELEQLRFDNKFDFDIKLEEGVNEFDTSVPAMLIQPYIENAIWHGLMNLDNKRRGKLSLNVSKIAGLLKITIEDNGIGREKAKEYKKADSHKSVGMLLTEQRLLMINKIQEYENAKVIVTDLYSDSKEAQGTKVEITIPLNAA